MEISNGQFRALKMDASDIQQSILIEEIIKVSPEKENREFVRVKYHELMDFLKQCPEPLAVACWQTVNERLKGKVPQ